MPNYADLQEVKEIEWIKANCSENHYYDLYEEFKAMQPYEERYLGQVITRIMAPPLRTLPFGMPVYGYKGVSVAFSDYCVQETHNPEDLRSLIFAEDGHVYTNWANPASILF
jgi:hypothetical protein